jgi:hypothetical protein
MSLDAHRRAVRSEIPASREISCQGESVLRDARSYAPIHCLAFGIRSEARKGLGLDTFVVLFGLSRAQSHA